MIMVVVIVFVMMMVLIGYGGDEHGNSDGQLN